MCSRPTPEASSGTAPPITFATRRRIGYIPEDRGLYPKMTVIAQLVYFGQLHGLNRKAAREASTTLLERLGLADRAKSQLQSLSHGNQQRVQLAAALVFSPDLLVLDEPFAGLDPVAVDAMTEILRGEADAGRPVVLSSHQLDIVERICDRVGIINHGQMVATGTVDGADRSRAAALLGGRPGRRCGLVRRPRRGDVCRAGWVALAAAAH